MEQTEMLLEAVYRSVESTGVKVVREFHPMLRPLVEPIDPMAATVWWQGEGRSVRVGAIFCGATGVLTADFNLRTRDGLTWDLPMATVFTPWSEIEAMEQQAKLEGHNPVLNGAYLRLKQRKAEKPHLLPVIAPAGSNWAIVGTKGESLTIPEFLGCVARNLAQHWRRDRVHIVKTGGP